MLALMQCPQLDRDLMPELEPSAMGQVSWESMEELEAKTNLAYERLGRLRLERASGYSLRTALAARLDAWARTDTLEYLDRKDTPEPVRNKLIHDLHRVNQTFFSYRRFLSILKPIIEELTVERSGPVRALELASGAGRLCFALEDEARRAGISLELTGSDIVPGYVDDNNVAAEADGRSLRFRCINGFDLAADVEKGDYDIVFIIQSTHHFAPGQVAMMIAQAKEAGAKRFISIDGRRNLSSLCVLPPLVAGITGSAKLAHDTWISARSFYGDAELELMARMAAPEARIKTTPHEPVYLAMDVRF